METVTHHLWIGFAGGLLAFAHCLGMCGGFVLHLSQEKDRKKMLTSQLLWQAGKLTTYMFLGAVAGFAGGFLQLVFLDQRNLQNLLSYGAGAVIVIMGLSLLGLLPVRAGGPGNSAVTNLAGFCRSFFTASSPGAALYLGMATGLLPCPIIIAFLAYSLSSGSVLNGMATMGALSLGTMLPLLLLGGLTRLTRLHLRSWAPKAGGMILIILGLSTALRGTAIYHHMLGCPEKPPAQQSHPKEIKPCCPGKAHASVGN